MCYSLGFCNLDFDGKNPFGGKSALLLEEAIALFVKYLHNEKGYSKHTQRNYQVDLEQFSSFW